MKILFNFPRFHTNNSGMVRVLHENSFLIQFHVVRESLVEDRDIVNPIVYEPSRMSLALSKLIDQSPSVLPFYFPEFGSYFKGLSEFDPDVVMIRSPLRLIALYTLLYCLIRRKPVIFYTQSPLTGNLFSTKAIFRKFLAYIFRGVWVSPIFFRDKRQDLIQTSQSQFLPFCIYSDVSINDIVVKSDRIRLLAVGKMVQRKNFSAILYALRLLVDHGVIVTLTIISEVSTKFQHSEFDLVKSLSKRLKLESHVEFLTNIHPNEMSLYYKDHDIFILASYNEPASVSLVEAMRSGCVPVISLQNGSNCYFVDSLDGFSFDPDEYKQIFSIIIKLTSSKKLLQSYKRKALESSFKLTNPEFFYSQFKSILDEVL
jgi:glycosyltransferase involved in cell wall biosynthesis